MQPSGKLLAPAFATILRGATCFQVDIDAYLLREEPRATGVTKSCPGFVRVTRLGAGNAFSTPGEGHEKAGGAHLASATARRQDINRANRTRRATNTVRPIAAREP